MALQVPQRRARLPSAPGNGRLDTRGAGACSHSERGAASEARVTTGQQSERDEACHARTTPLSVPREGVASSAQSTLGVAGTPGPEPPLGHGDPASAGAKRPLRHGPGAQPAAFHSPQPPHLQTQGPDSTMSIVPARSPFPWALTWTRWQKLPGQRRVARGECSLLSESHRRRTEAKGFRLNECVRVKRPYL